MPPSRSSLVAALSVIGPGLAVAATGVGAGDVIAAAVAGAQYGAVILWAAVAGAVIKGVLNEGIARWQLATGMTLLEGWGRYLHRPVLIGFAVYLVLWTFMVAGALMAACGLPRTRWYRACRSRPGACCTPPRPSSSSSPAGTRCSSGS